MKKCKNLWDKINQYFANTGSWIICVIEDTVLLFIKEIFLKLFILATYNRGKTKIDTCLQIAWWPF